jgi:CheY-like chemotaxis protein
MGKLNFFIVCHNCGCSVTPVRQGAKVHSPSVLLLDDNPMQHKLFECYATTMPDLTLQCVRNVEDALVVIGSKKPDVVILDNRLCPYTSYTQTMPLLRDYGFDGRIVVISSEVSNEMKRDPASNGVKAFVDKSEFNAQTFSLLLSSFLTA